MTRPDRVFEHARWMAHAMVLVLLAALARPAAAGFPRCVEHERWIALDTPRFTLFGNVTEARARELVTRLEWEAEALELRTGARAESRKIRVYALGDKACFEAFRPTVDGKPWQVVGYQMPTRRGHVVVFNAGLTSAEFRVVCHEYVHALVSRRFENLPLCLNEGLAEYFSTFQVGPDGAEYGHPIEARKLWVASRPLMTPDQLFAVGTASEAYRHGDTQQTFYCESWALVHYFMSTDALRDRFDDFIERLRDGAQPFAAFGASFPDLQWASLPATLQRYAAGEGMSHRVLRLGAELKPIEAKVSALSAAEVYTRLGELEADIDRQSPVAESYFRRALELDSLAASALVGLADWKERKGDVEAARALYARAAARPDAGAAALARAGSAAIARWEADSARAAAAEGTPPELLEARATLVRALELDPADDEALESFFGTFRHEDSLTADHVAALMRAINAAPPSGERLADLVALLARGKKVELARSLFRRLDRSSASPRVAWAENVLLSGEINRAMALANAGEAAKAESIATAIAEQARDPELQRFAREQRERIAAFRAANAAIDLYNRGVEAANHREYERAIEAFEQARLATKDPELAERASKNADDLRERLKRRAAARTK